MDYALQRSISDIQSKISTIDYQLMRMRAGAPGGPRPGRAFFASALAAIHRLAGEHERAAHIEERAATAPAQISVSGWASELASSPIAGLLLSIAKQSAYASVAARTQAFSIEELNRIVVGGEVSSGFTVEGGAIGVQAGALSPLSLSPKKITTLVSFSEEMLNTGINLANVLQELISRGVASTLDAAFLGNSAASTAAPAGILNGVSATTASTATPPSEAALADLKALVAALTSPIDPCFVVSPARQTYLTALLPGALGLPIFASGSIPAGRVICIDTAAVVAAHNVTPRFLVSRDASVHMDTSPTAISTPGTPNVISAPVRSMFQENLIALRSILWVAWALRSGGASYADVTAW